MCCGISPRCPHERLDGECRMSGRSKPADASCRAEAIEDEPAGEPQDEEG
jgi:hypothetical protein